MERGDDEEDQKVLGLRIILDFERTQISIRACVASRQVFILCDEYYLLNSWLAKHKKEVMEIVASQTGLKVREIHLMVDSHK